jgi:hypothetical protein
MHRNRGIEKQIEVVAKAVCDGNDFERPAVMLNRLHNFPPLHWSFERLAFFSLVRFTILYYLMFEWSFRQT